MQASQIGQASDQVKAGLNAVPRDPQLLNEGMFVSLVARDNTEAQRRFEDIERFYPNSSDALWSGCLYYYATLQSANAMAYCDRLATQFPKNHTAHSNYGWAALDANQIQVASREFSKSYDLVSPTWNQLTEIQVVDLLWGVTLTQYLSGDKKRDTKVASNHQREISDRGHSNRLAANAVVVVTNNHEPDRNGPQRVSEIVCARSAISVLEILTVGNGFL